MREPRGDPTQQLNAHDAMFVHFDNENWACHGGMVAIYDPSTAPGGTVRLRDILDHLERRLSASPIFRRRLMRVPLHLDTPTGLRTSTSTWSSHVRLPSSPTGASSASKSRDLTPGRLTRTARGICTADMDLRRLVNTQDNDLGVCYERSVFDL